VSDPVARRSRWSRRLLSAALLALLTLACAEAGVRVMNRLRLGRWTVNDPESAAVNTRMYVPHAWLGHMLRPGAEIISKGRSININSLGYRGPEFPSQKTPGRVRVVCIGGSTTFDVKVTDDAKSWPAQLERVLREVHDRNDVEVINGGTNGYAMPRTLIDLALRTLDIGPDVVICYPGVNDVAFADHTDHQAGRCHLAISAPPAQTPAWRDWLSQSELYNEIFSRMLYFRQARYGNWAGEPLPRQDEPEPTGMAAFERNLTTLAGICQSHGIRLALVTVRAAYRPDQPLEDQERLARSDLMDHPALSLAGHYRGYGEANAMIREAASRFGAGLIDQSAELPSRSEDFADSVHFSDSGAKAFAEFAAAKVVGLLGPAGLTGAVTSAAEPTRTEPPPRQSPERSE